MKKPSFFARLTGEAEDTPYRIEGGNDRLVQKAADQLRAPIRLRHSVRRIVQTKKSVRVTIENRFGQRSEIKGDYVLVTAFLAHCPSSARRRD